MARPGIEVALATNLNSKTYAVRRPHLAFLKARDRACLQPRIIVAMAIHHVYDRSCGDESPEILLGQIRVELTRLNQLNPKSHEALRTNPKYLALR
jgi:hypothetical protein